MTSLATVSPLLTAFGIAVVVTALHRRVRPQLAAALLTGGILAVTVAVVPTLVVLAVGFLVHLPLLGGGIEWCSVSMRQSTRGWVPPRQAYSLSERFGSPGRCARGDVIAAPRQAPSLW